MRAISSPSLIVNDMSSHNLEMLSCKVASNNDYDEKENQQTKSKETNTFIKLKRSGINSNTNTTATNDLYSNDNNLNKLNQQKISTTTKIELPYVEDIRKEIIVKDSTSSPSEINIATKDTITANTDSSCVKYRFGPLIWRSSKERRKTKFNRSDKCNSGDSGIQIELDGDENCTRILSMNNTINSLTSNNSNKCSQTKEKTNTTVYITLFC